MKKNLLPSKTISELLNISLKKNPNYTIYKIERNNVTKNQLIEKILKVRGGLSKKGLKKGDKVISILENSYEQIILFFACVTLGVIWVPLGNERKGLGLNYIINKIKLPTTNPEIICT